MRTPRNPRAVMGLFALTYLVSYLARVNLGAVVVQMELTSGMSRAQLSAAITGGFALYGVGQLLSGLAGDRISPKALVLGGLAVTGLMNFVLPLCRKGWVLILVWSINGLAQAFLWPPMVRLMAQLLPGSLYRRGVVAVTCASCLGTALVYLAAPTLLALGGYPAVFLACGLCVLATVALWAVRCPDLPPAGKKAGGEPLRALVGPGFWMLLGAVALQGLLRDGVTTWMPAYVRDAFGLEENAAILSGALLPALGALGYVGTGWLSEKFKNPVACAAWLFGAGAAAGALLWLTFGRWPGLTVVLTALLVGCMHGVNLLLVSILPGFFGKSGRVATLSGIINGFTYLGSACAGSGFAALAAALGWDGVALSWLLAALAGLCICLGVGTRWAKKGELS